MHHIDALRAVMRSSEVPAARRAEIGAFYHRAEARR
jgi:hypothetical protein